MKYRLGLYEKAMPDSLTLAEKLVKTRELGFDWMEFSVDATDEKLARLDWSKEQLTELKRASEEAGVPISTLALSGLRRYPLGSLDPEISRQGVETVRKAIDLCEYVGIRFIQMAGYDVVEEEGTEATRQMFLDNVRELVGYAALKGVVLTFENMHTNFTNDMTKCVSIVNEVNSPYLQLYPDVANLINFADYDYDSDSVCEDLRRAKGHIMAAHVKETNALKQRRIPFGSGNDHAQYVKHFKVLKELGCRMFLAEFWHKDPDYETVIRQASQFLRERLDQAFND